MAGADASSGEAPTNGSGARGGRAATAGAPTSGTAGSAPTDVPRTCPLTPAQCLVSCMRAAGATATRLGEEEGEISALFG